LKKLLSLVLVLALVLSSAVALADISSAKVVDTKERKINVKPAKYAPQTMLMHRNNVNIYAFWIDIDFFIGLW